MKYRTLNQCWFAVGPSSTTLVQHQASIGSACCVRWGVIDDSFVNSTDVISLTRTTCTPLKLSDSLGVLRRAHVHVKVTSRLPSADRMLGQRRT